MCISYKLFIKNKCVINQNEELKGDWWKSLTLVNYSNVNSG